MIPFQPFQQLYQPIKSDNPKLYQTLERISMYLELIIVELNKISKEEELEP